MASLRGRVEQLEKEQRFRSWLQVQRFFESLSEKQLEDLAVHWRFPEPLPEPLPRGASQFDRVDRKTLLKLWEESERETARVVDAMKNRSPDEIRFYIQHEHWPEAQSEPEAQSDRSDSPNGSAIALAHKEEALA